MSAPNQRGERTASERRAQSSVGSIILLIAALLIAAATAGVLFEVVGGFQSDAATASDKSADRVVARAEVIGTTGHVNTTGNTVEAVTLVVKRAEGGGNMDLNDVVVGTTIGSGADAAVGSSTEISLTTLSDDDDSLSRGILNDESDRAALRIDLAALTGVELQPSESGTIRLLSPDGATTTVRVSVPSTLDGETTVAV
ncbi:flagellin [Haloarcula sp. CBA1130]|uniref:archaellin/type IV pilin N-terminal domain-containing protein n=1 Tax=unclassified Haloarcula TaxID=2624677 RepID=UPI0012486305|nr:MULTISPECIES: archaellin/type IV pilin N-terminal domain-containing protein [unclassified Haloarcula]KAA9399823.1 flagellin [Haloarcula sp. CBA1129]KAA9401518.1 flagellin [Haloarcula sp. CBA1130]